MLDQDIVINGVSVNKLAEDKRAIREGATKLIADNIAEVQTLVKAMVLLKDAAPIENMASKALALLDAAATVSSVSGVQYYLPYYDNWNDDDVISELLENSENKVIQELIGWQSSSDVKSLRRLAESMENESKNWNTSNC
jgi:hypothetical protein